MLVLPAPASVAPILWIVKRTVEYSRERVFVKGPTSGFNGSSKPVALRKRYKHSSVFGETEASSPDTVLPRSGILQPLEYRRLRTQLLQFNHRPGSPNDLARRYAQRDPPTNVTIRPNLVVLSLCCLPTLKVMHRVAGFIHRSALYALA